MDAEDKLSALARVARALNGAGVTWAVGASALLYFEGIADTFNDLDLMIAEGDMPAAAQAMRAIGANALTMSGPSAAYATEYFFEYQLNDVDFDLLCGFAIRRADEVYRYPFSGERVVSTTQVNGETVPLTPLADWYVLYLLMPARKPRVTDRPLFTGPPPKGMPPLADAMAVRPPAGGRAGKRAGAVYRLGTLIFTGARANSPRTLFIRQGGASCRSSPLRAGKP